MTDESTTAHDELLTFDEALRVLGTSRATLYRLLGQGDVKGLKVGKQWRFRRVDLVAYVQRSPVAIAGAPAGVLSVELDYFEGELIGSGQAVEERPDEPDEMVGALVRHIYRLAVDRRASDIHIDPIRLDGVICVWVRFRIDGVLHEVRRMPLSLHAALFAEIKVSANMDPVEKRTQQNGRLRMDDFDFRIAVVPSFNGEMATIRIGRTSAVQLTLDELGIAPDDAERLSGLLNQPNGIILVTGPSGSGKTTTLYSCVGLITDPARKLVSVENPIEYELPLVNQIQVNERAGQTFPTAVRACFRLDPDVFILSDDSTASAEALSIVAEASLSGHLVLTSMTCADSVAAITRLIDIGLEPYLVPATVIGIVAQRICRKICSSCREAYEVPASELGKFGFAVADPCATVTLYRGRGCDECRQRQYRGRVGLYQLLTMNEEIGDLIIARAPISEIRAAAKAAGMRDLRDDALDKVLAGVTTPDEVLRVLSTSAV